MVSYVRVESGGMLGGSQLSSSLGVRQPGRQGWCARGDEGAGHGGQVGGATQREPGGDGPGAGSARAQSHSL